MKKYIKTRVLHTKFYMIKFVRDFNAPYIIFIHGGPGFNCGVIEYLIEHEKIFHQLECNIILYDQRGCGRSIDFPLHPSHSDNIQDLYEIYLFLNKIENLKIKAFMGHSYGSKLLFDFYKKFNINIPAIFLAIADSMLTPRLNNLMLDLRYLKTRDKPKYEEILAQMENISFEKLWDITERLNPLFQENKERPLMYWANLQAMEKVKKIQEIIDLPMNNDTFMSVRKEFYATLESCSVNINSLNIPFLWINGLHDGIMNGQDAVFRNTKKLTFLKSAHYPHIEENQRFCEVVNEFMRRIL